MTSIATNAYHTSQSITPTSVEAFNTATDALPTTTKSVAIVETTDNQQSGLTAEGKNLIDALNQVDDAGKAFIEGKLIEGDKTVADHIESFTYGALGIDHPNESEKISDDSYSAGQYLKGALTVGGLLLAIV